jgi:hypothetical protein
LGLIAAAIGRRVGVDVERRRDVEDWQAIALETFGAEFSNRLSRLARQERVELFFRYWTVGEAFSKATGLGLAGLGGRIPLKARSSKLTDFEIAGGPPAQPGMQWSILELDVDRHYASSMIVEAEEGRAVQNPTTASFTLPSRFECGVQSQ